MSLPPEEMNVVRSFGEPPSFRQREVSGCTLLEAAGEIDLESAPVFRESLAGAMESGSAQVVVDLSKVTFMDSVALSVLLGAQQRAGHEGGWIRLVGPTHGARKILQVSGVEDLLPIYETLEAAIAGASSRRV